MLRLQVYSKGQLAQAPRLLPGRYLLGRLDHCTLVLPGEGVSREHLRLDVGPTEVVVTNLSEKRVFVNGAPVVQGRSARLEVGGELQVGRFQILLVRETEETSPEKTPTLDEIPFARKTPPGRVLAGTSALMERLHEEIELAASCEKPVHICGPTGTGKEVVARTIHERSAVAEGPLFALNCGTLPSTLVESTLFGHEKGAFTGATERRGGAFHAADGGSLYLDELAGLARPHQVALLRVLETGDVLRVGARAAERPKVRLITSANRSLKRMAEDGEFLEDLYFRAVVLLIRTPALREHPEDLEEIARDLIERDGATIAFDAKVIRELQAREWRGNVRELRSMVSRFALRHPNSVITLRQLREDDEQMSEERSHGSSGRPTAVVAQGKREGKRRGRPAGLFSLDQVKAALGATGGNRTKAAELLGWAKSTLVSRMKALGVTWGVPPEEGE